MARGVNKVILVGHLGQDPEVRQLPSGSSVVNFSLATTDGWTDNTGQKQERTEWHRIVMFNRLAEIAGQYLRKGAQVYLEGSLRTKQWEKDGVQRYTTEIAAREMQMLGGRSGGDSGSYSQNQSYNQSSPQQSPPPPQSPPPQQQPQQGATPDVDFGDLDDDLPF